MSKWGIEEKETLEAINKVGLSGNILNIAAGDGRFNNTLLELAHSVVAIDLDCIELQELKDSCPNNFKNKLSTKIVDITKRFPFDDNTFDGIFCTGTLHLFDMNTIKEILSEIKRVLKVKGKMVLDFATDITRIDKEGNKKIFSNEGNYVLEEAIKLFQGEFKEFDINIEISKFKEENLQESAGYESISGNFLIISGSKIRLIEKIKDETER